tara:strand:+ start:678 stop:890 length:213 start_codon:yes stop_codon:yes gene_type:complete
MTEFYEAVEKQRELIDREKKSKQVRCIETKIKDGLWYEQTTDYEDGRRVIEFRDSRKKTIEEYPYGKVLD